MRKICIILTLLTVTMWIPGASAQNAENSPSDADIQRVENLLATMTVEQKVGQMFMVSLFGHGMTEQGEDLLRTYQPGAVAIFGFNTDFEPAPQVARLLNEMQAIAVESGAGIPLIIAADQEGGDVRRIVNDVTKFPDPMGFGAITNLVSIEHIGQATGAELRAIGVNMNLAPIADLYTPEDITDENRVLHRRTFGDDPERVGVQVAAYSDGLAEAGVIGVLKHFPGHGGAEDSHQTLPQIDMDYETAMSTALRSFQVAIEQNVPAIMVGHLYYGAIEPVPNLPASLSPTMNHILREDFGFDGVIMTDALDMSAVSETYTVPQAALMAIQAGDDMAVMGPHVSWQSQRDAIQGVIDAVNAGEIPLERIDASVRRILLLKVQYDLLDWEPIDTAQLLEKIDLEASEAVLLESYLDVATVVRDDEHLLPLRPDDNAVIIYPANYVRIFNACAELAPDVKYYGYTFHPQFQEISAVANLGRTYDKIVIVVQDILENGGQGDLVIQLPPEKTVIVALGSPHDLELFPAYSTIMALYTSLPASHLAACHVLFGEHPITGRLPVAIQGYATGSGIDIFPEGDD